MGARSGHGGTVFEETWSNVAGTQTVTNRTFHNTQWTLDKTSRLADVTDSSAGGFERRKLIVRGGTFKFEFIWKDDNIPDTDATLDAGTEGTLRFYLGATTGNKFYKFAAIIESVELVNSQVDVIKGTVSGFVNGAITNPVTGVIPQGL